MRLYRSLSDSEVVPVVLLGGNFYICRILNNIEEADNEKIRIVISRTGTKRFVEVYI